MVQEEQNYSSSSSSSSSKGRVLIITGSTGSMGNYLLNHFLQESTFDKIYCLNRSEDAYGRQSKSHPLRGLHANFYTDKVEFWKAEFDKDDDLGLGKNRYNQLLIETTHILHNAWPVDFNRKVASFTSSIRGTKNLINLAYKTIHHCTFFFVSSMSTAANWGRYSGLLDRVPEIPLGDWRLARMGYGQSKLIVEKMLEDVSQVEGMNVIICRVGQVAGPVLNKSFGMWNKQEWLPSLIASSIEMGFIPKTLGPIDQVDWIPVDILTKVIAELLLTPIEKNKLGKSKLQIYHALNPNSTNWSALLPVILENSRKTLEPVSIVEWVDRLEQAASLQPQAQEKLPAINLLLVFFENLRDKSIRFPRASSSPLDTTQSSKASKTLRTCPPVSPEWMQIWMDQWKF